MSKIIPTITVRSDNTLTRLADKEADVISEDGCIAVKKITGQVYHHRQLCQLFKQLSSLSLTYNPRKSISVSSVSHRHYLCHALTNQNRPIKTGSTAAWLLWSRYYYY